MAGRVELRKELDDALCNYLARLYHFRKQKETRYHLFTKIHISDIIDCPVRSLVMRVFDVVPPCRLLYLQQEGLKWEKEAIEAIKARYPNARIYDRKVKEKTILGKKWEVIGTPDITMDWKILEVKWTRFYPDDIFKILRNKGQLARAIWGYNPIVNEAYTYKIWPSWVYQLFAYHYITHPGYEMNIYANRGHFVDTITIKITRREREEALKKFIDDSLIRYATLLTYYRTKLYAPWHDLEKLVWRELRDVYCLIWKTPELYVNVEFRCRLCPLWWMGTCPGVIPLRKFYSDELDRFLWDKEEIEILRRFFGISHAFQSWLYQYDRTLAEMLRTGRREDYKRILQYLADNHNDTSFLAEMIRKLGQNCYLFGRERPMRGRFVELD